MRLFLVGALCVVFPGLAFADTPTFYKDPTSGCQVGTFKPDPQLSVRWNGPCVGGKAQGRGIVEWSLAGKFASRTEAEFRAGLIEGRAIVVSADGTLREAEFRDSKREGRCITIFASGERFEGQCANDVANGPGKEHFASGDAYYGDFRNDKMTGHGVYKWKNGTIYEGDFVDGKSEGRGKIVGDDESWYEGEFHNDKFDGEGIEVFSDGAYYQGHWSDGHPDGRGDYVGISSSGKPNVWSGIWHHGCFEDGDMTAAVTTSRDSCGFDD